MFIRLATGEFPNTKSLLCLVRVDTDRSYDVTAVASLTV